MDRRLWIAIALAVIALSSALLVATGNIPEGVAVILVPGVALIGAWTYLVWIVRTNRGTLFHDRMEPKSAERRLRWLRACLMVAGASLLVAILGGIVHNVLGGLLGVEEAVSFFSPVIGLGFFAMATASGLGVFLIGRREQDKGALKQRQG